MRSVMIFLHVFASCPLDVSADPNDKLALEAERDIARAAAKARCAAGETTLCRSRGRPQVVAIGDHGSITKLLDAGRRCGKFSGAVISTIDDSRSRLSWEGELEESWKSCVRLVARSSSMEQVLLFP